MAAKAHLLYYIVHAAGWQSHHLFRQQSPGSRPNIYNWVLGWNQDYGSGLRAGAAEASIKGVPRLRAVAHRGETAVGRRGTVSQRLQRL
eukprot:COSAG01_NODE_256_length_20138_cov_24.233694_7_plen_89_part_00